MARLIPAEVSAKCPKGERRVLEWLKAENVISRDWVVLHSLDIRRHVTKLEGEADFLVLAPSLGVLCVEVKGCDVRRVNGIWMYSHGGSSPEGPFGQARSAMHSLRKILADKGVTAAANRLFASCALFTEIDLSMPSVEWNPWENIGRSAIEKNGVASCLASVLEAEHRHVVASRQRGVSAGWYDAEKSRPDKIAINQIAEFLRPSFGYEGERSNEIARLEASISCFTDEQIEAANGASGNTRIIYTGAAGTGKTFLALYLAREWAMQGKRVGLICFNRRLGRWLETECTRMKDRPVYVGTLHRLMREVVNDKTSDDIGNEYWADLPARAADHLLEQDHTARFDALVMDEAQDLMRPEYLDVLGLLLDGGLKGGRWAMMGDLERQAIYANYADGSQLLAELETRSGPTATYSLRTNCRNAKRVARSVSVLGGLRPNYPRTLNVDIEGDVIHHFVSGQVAVVEKLQEILKELARSFRPEQVVILSQLADAQCAAARLAAADEKLPLIPMPNDGPRQGKFGWCSIHAFKGMEASAVVLTDLAGWQAVQDEALFYVGISRARVRVELIMDKRLEKAYSQRLMNQFG